MYISLDCSLDNLLLAATKIATGIVLVLSAATSLRPEDEVGAPVTPVHPNPQPRKCNEKKRRSDHHENHMARGPLSAKGGAA